MLALSKSDELFISIFKHIQIVDADGGGYHVITDSVKPGVFNQYIPNKEVLRLVKEYQEAILESLMSK